MKKMTRNIFLISFSMLLVSCDNVTESNKQEDSKVSFEPYKTSDINCKALKADETCAIIGVAAPLTGDISHLGKDIANGVNIAVNDINFQNNLIINGKKVKLTTLIKDDASNADIGKTVANALVKSGVVGVVGHLNSGVSIPANPIYAKANIVQVSPASTNPDLTLKGAKTPAGLHSSFRTVANDLKQGKVLGHYMARSNPRSVVVLDDGSKYGKDLSIAVKKALKSKGVFVSLHETVPEGSSDFTSVVSKMKSLNPDFVFWGGFDEQAAALAAEKQKQGVYTRLISGDGSCSEKFIEFSKNSNTKLVCTQVGKPLSKMAQGKVFEAKYSKFYPKDKPQAYSPFAYDATFAIVESMKRADSLKPQAITANMPQVNFAGLTGEVAFDAYGDTQNGAISIFKITDKLSIDRVYQ